MSLGWVVTWCIRGNNARQITSSATGTSAKRLCLLHFLSFFPLQLFMLIGLLNIILFWQLQLLPHTGWTWWLVGCCSLSTLEGRQLKTSDLSTAEEDLRLSPHWYNDGHTDWRGGRCGLKCDLNRNQKGTPNSVNEIVNILDILHSQAQIRLSQV